MSALLDTEVVDVVILAAVLEAVLGPHRSAAVLPSPDHLLV